MSSDLPAAPSSSTHAPVAGSTGTTQPRVQLVGYNNFVRHNPRSDKFQVLDFSHIEFYCGDALTAAGRFTWGFGMPMVAKSDQSTGNQSYASYVLQSHDVVFAFTCPYGMTGFDRSASTSNPNPSFNPSQAHDFIRDHGLAVRAIGMKVSDATQAYNIAVTNGGIPISPPTTLVDTATGKTLVMCEIKLYGDSVVRFLSGDFDGPYLPNYVNVPHPSFTYGLSRVDHIVGNVPSLVQQVEYMMNFTGWHEFAEFVSDDVGTVDSGLNSMVLANNTETVLLPVNEPTFGTRRKSQIQTYIEQNSGPGVQHIALQVPNIFETMREMRSREHLGGFAFMPKPSRQYYENLPAKIGDVLTAEQYRLVDELGLLVDKDDQGTLLQVFTKPLGDRMTVFVEIIQRIGCTEDEHGEPIPQKAGCGGFGKGNFSELFKSIEEYQKILDGTRQEEPSVGYC